MDRKIVAGVAALAIVAAMAPAVARQARPATASAPASAAAVPPAAPSAPRLLAETQALFDGYVRAGRLPGIAGAFGVGDYPTAFVSAGRIATDDSAPAAGPDTLWRVYSMTKPVTGIAAMILIEEGKLKLDQPISDFFPAYRKMRVLTAPDTSLESVPARTPITVRHLLTHTAGLGYSIVQKGPIAREYERLGLVPAALNPQAEAQARAARPTSLAAFAERVATVPLVYEPGTKWSYSISLDVLGAVIEKASGMPFDRFLQTRIFTPLAMRSTGFTVPATDAARLATLYAYVGPTPTPIDPGAGSVFLSPPSFPYGGAGLVSSARDYDRFLHMLQNGGTLDGVRIMKPGTVALAMSDLLPAGVTFGGIGGNTGGTDGPQRMGFGAGGSVYLEGRPGGASKGTFGWGGAAGTIAWVDPTLKARGTVMVQYFPPDRIPLREEVPAALMRDAARLHPAPR